MTEFMPTWSLIVELLWTGRAAELIVLLVNKRSGIRKRLSNSLSAVNRGQFLFTVFQKAGLLLYIL